jgi:hypothetical protein
MELAVINHLEDDLTATVDIESSVFDFDLEKDLDEEDRAIRLRFLTGDLRRGEGEEIFRLDLLKLQLDFFVSLLVLPSS